MIRGIAVGAGIPRFSTHTLRHLCLTDLARAGWELHMIATFAGHRSLATTLQYIHLSGRDLASKLARGMAEVHAWRVAQLGELLDGSTPCLLLRSLPFRMRSLSCQRSSLRSSAARSQLPSRSVVA